MTLTPNLALLAGLDLTDLGKLAAAAALGATLGWDIRVRNAASSARRRQAALAAIAFFSALLVLGLLGEGAAWLTALAPLSADIIVPLSATALVVLVGTAVVVLLHPGVGGAARKRDMAFSLGFAFALGLTCGAGLPHVAIVIVPAGVLFLNLMRWTPPTTPATASAAN